MRTISPALATALKHATLVLLLATGHAPAAQADDGLLPFRTPSGNIYCMGLSGDEGAHVDCEMVEITRFTLPLKKPADCDQEWGDRFSLDEENGPYMQCYGDTLRNDEAPVLAYGKSIQIGPMHCTSRKSGLECLDSGGHGFRLSKASQEFF